MTVAKERPSALRHLTLVQASVTTRVNQKLSGSSKPRPPPERISAKLARPT